MTAVSLDNQTFLIFQCVSNGCCSLFPFHCEKFCDPSCWKACAVCISSFHRDCKTIINSETGACTAFDTVLRGNVFQLKQYSPVRQKHEVSQSSWILHSYTHSGHPTFVQTSKLSAVFSIHLDSLLGLGKQNSVVELIFVKNSLKSKFKTVVLFLTVCKSWSKHS